MKKSRIVFFLSCICFIVQLHAGVKMISTSEQSKWKLIDLVKEGDNKRNLTTSNGAKLCLESPAQKIAGFGACFNELGWTSLQQLSSPNIEFVFKELFTTSGANFNLCRIPIGANDFSRDWYSYSEIDGDFGMKHFSTENDKQTLIPFIKKALMFNPTLKLWASPWSPPSWMKTNKHYACAPTDNSDSNPYRNGMDVSQKGAEGTNMFITSDKYMKAYSLYFRKFIKEYAKAGIKIGVVMPQNEFNSCQIFPSCCWRPQELGKFIADYLIPTMKKENVDVYIGTMERPSFAMLDTILKTKNNLKEIKGVGFQWAGKHAVAQTHSAYPHLHLLQSEQECGDGQNTWKGAAYSWELMKHYFKAGVSGYLYWNFSLLEGGISRWGWAQNSLIVVNPKTKQFEFTLEYYVMKHISHFVEQQAEFIPSTGSYTDLLAFRNPDNSIVVIEGNMESEAKVVELLLEKKKYQIQLPAYSINTIVVD